jgi:hypothetical protein
MSTEGNDKAKATPSDRPGPRLGLEPRPDVLSSDFLDASHLLPLLLFTFEVLQFVTW